MLEQEADKIIKDDGGDEGEKRNMILVHEVMGQRHYIKVVGNGLFGSTKK